MITERHIAGIGMTSRRTRERLITRLIEEGIKDYRVLDQILHTPRHLFVDEALASRAYENNPLPIGYGQTISQPYIVARMTEVLLETGVPDKVLEIGTGCGYQSAVLARLVPHVFTIERIKPLLDQAKERFRQLKLYNVRTRHGDGFEGWPSQGPFDAIILTAAPEILPQTLLDQLADNGRLIAPVGGRDGGQELMVYEKHEGKVTHRKLGMVSFVPMLPGKQ